MLDGAPVRAGCTLMLGDCLDRMSEIADGSIDMILADLPYGTTACKWDAIIPFEPLWAHYRRVVKPNAAIVLTASQPFTSALVMSNPKWFRYEWIWEKSKASGFLNARRKPLAAHESVLVFGPARPPYIPQKVPGRPFSAANRVGYAGSNTPTTNNVASPLFRNDNIGDRFPRSVQYFRTAEREGGLHPTQKPVALMEYLIRTYTSEGETVLDNTMGSGTTGVAAANTGRAFIGIERDPAYFETARQRIDAAHI